MLKGQEFLQRTWMFLIGLVGFIAVTSVLSSGHLIAQNLSSTMMDQKNTLSSTLQLRRSAETAGAKSLTGTYSSINPEEYIVDSGDEFLVTIDIQGPEIMIYNIKVSSDGFLSIPNSPGIYVRNRVLSEMIREVENILKSQYPLANIEVNLDKIHPIQVHITGALLRTEKIEMTSGNRLHDAIEDIINVYHEDTLLTEKFKKASLRNVSIIRDDDKKVYDVLKFRNAGTRAENPYLMDDDVINIAYRDTTGGDILVSGLVGKTLSFEYKKGDDLETALKIAGGMMPTADSSYIMLYRFTDKGTSFDLEIVDYKKTPAFPLLSDDRIYVRRKSLYHLKSSVTVEGEVKFPGEYPIILDQTKLSEIIEQCGGFTQYADFHTSRLIRDGGIIPGEDELDRIGEASTTNMSLIEKSYWASSTQQNLNVVQCDFSKLFNENDPDQDVILENEDLIEIGTKMEYIYVSGAVVNPGIIKYNNQWGYLDYIAASGGYKKSAQKKKVTLIKYRTNAWIDAKEGISVEAGDRLFVPQKKDRTIQDDALRDALTTISQIFTIILVLLNIQRVK